MISPLSRYVPQLYLILLLHHMTYVLWTQAVARGTECIQQDCSQKNMFNHCCKGCLNQPINSITLCLISKGRCTSHGALHWTFWIMCGMKRKSAKTKFSSLNLINLLYPETPKNEIEVSMKYSIALMFLSDQRVVAIDPWTSETSARNVEINRFNAYISRSRSQVHSCNFRTKVCLYTSSH